MIGLFRCGGPLPLCSSAGGLLGGESIPAATESHAREENPTPQDENPTQEGESHAQEGESHAPG